MIRRFTGLILAALVLSYAFVLRAQWQDQGALTPHAHTGTNDGGANITPTGITTIPPGSTLRVKGQVDFSASTSPVTGNPTFSSMTITSLAISSLTNVSSLVMSTMTAKSIPFIDANKLLVENNGALLWDYTNLRLGINVTSPASSFDAESIASGELGRFRVRSLSNNPALLIQGNEAANNITLTEAGSANGGLRLATNGGTGLIVDVNGNTQIPTLTAQTINGNPTIASATISLIDTAVGNYAVSIGTGTNTILYNGNLYVGPGNQVGATVSPAVEIVGTCASNNSTCAALEMFGNGNRLTSIQAVNDVSPTKGRLEFYTSNVTPVDTKALKLNGDGSATFIGAIRSTYTNVSGRSLLDDGCNGGVSNVSIGVGSILDGLNCSGSHSIQLVTNGAQSAKWDSTGLMTTASPGIQFNDGSVATSTGALTPAWADFNPPSWTGFSANPTCGNCRWTYSGKRVTVNLRFSAAGTSNATAHTMTIPVNSKAAQAFIGTGTQDNSATSTTPCMVVTRSNSNVTDVYKDIQAGAWTAAGSANCDVNMTYESQ